MPYYMVFRSNLEAFRQQRMAGGSQIVPYECVTAVEADDANDAVQQVVSAAQVMGDYAAIECDPVTVTFTPKRLQLDQ